MNSRRTESLLQAMLGFLAIAATLVLVSPGVQIAQAADQGVAPAARVSVDPLLARRAELRVPETKAPSCENPGEALLDDALLAHPLRDLVRRAVAEQPRAPQSSEYGIVLNSRGYNYRPTPME